jgi:CHAP domain
MNRTLGLAMQLRPLARLGLTTLTLAFAVCAAQLPASARVRPTATFVVDGVKVAASGADLQGQVLSSNPGDATQETTVLDLSHRRVISVIAVPFGTRPATEDALPFAHRGGAQAYHQALHDFRSRDGEFALDAPPIHLFGRLVTGDVGQRTEHLKSASGREVNRDVFTIEWVAEAGPRLWIVRARLFEPAGHGMADVYDFANSLSGLTIWAEGSLSAPTTIAPDTADGATARPSVSPDQMQDRKPPFYASGCDTENYDRVSGRTDWRNRLGATFRGIPACGPRPAMGAPLVPAGFIPAAPAAVFQFDAMEFSLRWMYLGFGTPPIPGNGDQLLTNYDPLAGGQPLFKYANVPGGAVHPQPGDVLCYDTGGSGGHTSVVAGTHVDSRGNGWIDAIEQNNSARGFAQLRVIGGEVVTNLGGPIFGWLSPRPNR